MYISKANIQNNIMLHSSSSVREFCLPLFKFLKINYFNFTRIYKTGERARLGTNALVIEQYYLKDWYNFAAFERNPDLYCSGYFYWDNSDNSNLAKLKSFLFDNYGMSNVFSVVRKYNDFIDVYNFAPDEGNKLPIESYMAQINIINDFIDLFECANAELINLACKEKFMLPLKKELLFADDGSGLQNGKAVEDFYNEILYNKKKPFRFFVNGTYLTIRETECLTYTTMGMTIKEIAIKLKISPRTVETHINNIKLKSNIQYKHQLCQKIINLKKLNSFINILNIKDIQFK